jgi:hypothetical protein
MDEGGRRKGEEGVGSWIFFQRFGFFFVSLFLNFRILEFLSFPPQLRGVTVKRSALNKEGTVKSQKTFASFTLLETTVSKDHVLKIPPTLTLTHQRRGTKQRIIISIDACIIYMCVLYNYRGTEGGELNELLEPEINIIMMIDDLKIQ